MSPAEQDRLTALENRIFGLDGTGGLAGDVRALTKDISEIRGGIRVLVWMGPVGLAALVFGVAKSSGLL